MSAEPASSREAARDDADAGVSDRPVNERAEEIVERVSAQVTRFTRRLVARAREEGDDIVAEAQTIRRGDHRPG
jgi:hypothetical protein